MKPSSSFSVPCLHVLFETFRFPILENSQWNRPRNFSNFDPVFLDEISQKLFRFFTCITNSFLFSKQLFFSFYLTRVLLFADTHVTSVSFTFIIIKWTRNWRSITLLLKLTPLFILCHWHVFKMHLIVYNMTFKK